MRRANEGGEQVLGSSCVLGRGSILHVLELLAIALQGGIELLVLAFQEGHLSLGIVLLLLALLELGLCGLYLFLDVGEEQVLIQRVDLPYVVNSCLLLNGHSVIIDQ